MLKNKMKSYVRIGGRGLKNLTYPYMGGGFKNYQKHPNVINEWPLNVQDLIETEDQRGIAIGFYSCFISLQVFSKFFVYCSSPAFFSVYPPSFCPGNDIVEPLLQWISEGCLHKNSPCFIFMIFPFAVVLSL